MGKLCEFRMAAAILLGWAMLGGVPASAQSSPQDKPATDSPAANPASPAQPTAPAQEPAASAPATAPPATPAPESSDATPAASFAAPPAPLAPSAIPAAAPATTAKLTYTVPAGTKVLLQLRSAINSKSAKAGDGVYLASTFPVVVGNRVMIPAGVYVQGIVDRVERAGHVKGKAQLDMHFTSIIFPNGSVVEVPGLVDSLPGASNQQVKDNGEGTIEQSPDKARNIGKVAEIALPTGGTVGTIGGAVTGHPIAGGLAGIGAGLAAMGIATLFTRGADVNIESGTQVEMVLQRPLILEEQNLASNGAPDPATTLVPAANQPKPMEKPNHARVLCPPGGLGCE